MTLTAMPYLGGKSGHPRLLLGRWVASLLPTDARLYCEPFAGMCGVLLQRPPAEAECVNDLDGRIVNWWRVVRDDHAALAARLEETPWARDEYEACLNRLDDPDPVEAARAVTVVLAMSIKCALGSDPANWRWIRPRPRRAPSISGLVRIVDALPALAERMRLVVIENRPALDIIRREGASADTLIYADPPYPTAEAAAHYGEALDDADAHAEAFLTAKARVAVSGYAGDWPVLDAAGWTRHELETTRHNGSSHSRAIECVWTNYEPSRAKGTLF